MMLSETRQPHFSNHASRFPPPSRGHSYLGFSRYLPKLAHPAAVPSFSVQRPEITFTGRSIERRQDNDARHEHAHQGLGEGQGEREHRAASDSIARHPSIHIMQPLPPIQPRHCHRYGDASVHLFRHALSFSGDTGRSLYSTAGGHDQPIPSFLTIASPNEKHRRARFP